MVTLFMETQAQVLIIGGGIAGLSAAHHLAAAGARDVCLLEREGLLASHSTGRNAAIFRQLDLSARGAELALRSRVLLDALIGESREGWLRATSAVYLASREQPLEALSVIAQRLGVACEPLGENRIWELLPCLSGGEVSRGLLVPGDGVIDIHSVISALSRAAAGKGARLRTGAEVARILAAGDRVEGVELRGGERLTAEVVVVAAGAWAAELGKSCGAELPLVPLRRHLALLDVGAALGRESPVAWRVDDEAYFRPESGGALACPCDEEPFPPGLPPTSSAALELLGAKLGRLAPGLAGSSVRRAWACLRTFAPDRDMVVGEDPRVRGLFWLGGLGGHGMSAGMAAGELLASLIVGRNHPLAEELSPARVLSRHREGDSSPPSSTSGGEGA